MASTRINPPKSVSPSLQLDTLKLLSRLLQIPQVEPWIQNTAQYLLSPMPFYTTFIMPGSLLSQPVELLHAAFCLGAPLCTLLDMLGLPSPPSLILDHDPSVFPYLDMDLHDREAYVQSFIQRVSLLESTRKIRYGEVMRSSDLWSGGSVGWAKVLKTVNRVLDGLQETYPGVYVQSSDASTHRQQLLHVFQQSERDQIQLIKTLKDELVALGLERNPLLESVLVNLERIEEWHERILSSWKSSLSVDELLDWDAVFGNPMGDPSRSKALGAYRSLCAGLSGITDFLTSPKLAHSGHHNGPEVLEQLGRILKQIPRYVHLFDQFTIFVCPPLSPLSEDVAPHLRTSSNHSSSGNVAIFSDELTSSPSNSFASLSRSGSTSSKPSLYQFASRASSLMSIRRTASATSTPSTFSGNSATITKGPMQSSPQSTIGRSVSYEASRSLEALSVKSWASLHGQLHSLYHLALSMAEVGATVKGMWGSSVVQEFLCVDLITLEGWGAFVMDDTMAVSLRRMGEDHWEELEVEVYVFERAIVVCPARSSSLETAEDAYPVMAWSPGPALSSPRRDMGEGSILSLIPLRFQSPHRVTANFVSDLDGERFVILWPGHALEFLCVHGTPGAGHSQWEMWCSVLRGLRLIDVHVQISVPSPSSLTENELKKEEDLSDSEEDEYEKYIDVSPGPGSAVHSRAATPLSQMGLDTDQAYDDASLRIPSPFSAGGQVLPYPSASKPKPWSLIGRKGPRSEASSFIQTEEDSDEFETQESAGSFVVGDHEGSEDGEDGEHRDEISAPSRRHHRKKSSHQRRSNQSEPHDSGFGIKSTVERWGAISESERSAPHHTSLSSQLSLPDLGDLRDLTGQIELEGRYPIASGGYGDVWKAELNDAAAAEGAPTSVAVKVLRARADDPEIQIKVQRRLNRELEIWKRLSHSHVLPLLGVAHDAFGGYGYAMVCPWLENGSVSRWMEKCGDVLGVKERLELVCQVADGLSYLHSQSIVHGDLSGSNILINDVGRAVLCDFGLSSLVAQLELQNETPNSIMGGGSVRWADASFFKMSLSDGSEEFIPPPMVSTKSDIYSFGSVMLEILSGRIPYHYIRTEAQVVIELHQGNKPRRPAWTFVDDKQWELIQNCWQDDSSLRPDIGSVSLLVHQLKEDVEVRPVM